MMFAPTCRKTFGCKSFIKMYANTPSLLTLTLGFIFSFKSTNVLANSVLSSPGSEFLGVQTRVDNPSSKDPQNLLSNSA